MRLTVKQISRYTKYLEEQKEARVVQQERVRSAAAQGDLSENAEFDAANLELAKINSRIATLEDVLSDPTTIDTPTDNNVIGIGSIVKIAIMGIGHDNEEVSTGIKELDRDAGEIYELVEVSTISIPGIEELTVNSLVGKLLLGKTFNPIGINEYPYKDNDNVSRKLIILGVGEDLEISKG